MKNETGLHSHRHALHHAGALPTLSTNRLLGFAGAAIISLFFPIFLYEFFDLSLQHVLFWFLLNFFVKIPSSILGAKLFSRIGLRNAMFIGGSGIVLFFLANYLLSIGIGNTYLLLTLAILGLDLSTTFYWAPFHIDMATFTKKGKRGRVMARMNAAMRLIGIGAPVLGGYLVTQFGFAFGFFAGLVIYASSLIPLLFMENVFVTYEFGFFETFKQLFSKKYRRMAVSMVTYGAEDFVGAIVWPLFLFSVFAGDYLDVGIFAAIIVVIGLALELVVGKEADTKALPKLLQAGSVVYAAGWVWKAFVDTVIGVFAASTFHSFGSIMLRTPVDTMMYERAADSGHYIDEFTVIREVGLNIGRVLMILLILLLTTQFDLTSSFLLAALASLGVTVLVRRSVK